MDAATADMSPARAKGPPVDTPMEEYSGPFSEGTTSPEQAPFTLPGLSLLLSVHRHFSTIEKRRKRKHGLCPALVALEGAQRCLASWSQKTVQETVLCWPRPAQAQGLGLPRGRLRRLLRGWAGGLSGCFPNLCMISRIRARLVLPSVKSQRVAPMS